MPIEFQPPQANLNYQITPPQYTDPLATLAQMGQIRNQNLQRQGAEQELELNRAKLDSQKGMLRAMVESGGDMKRFESLISQPGYNILPGDALAYQEHRTKLQQDIANLGEKDRANMGVDIDRYRGLISNVQNQDELDNANATAENLRIPENIPRHRQFSDPAHVVAFSNSLGGQKQLLEEAKEKAATKASEATATTQGLQATKVGQEIEAGEKAQVIGEIQAADQDPTTGTPTPAAMAAIQARHPKVKLPLPTKDAVERFIRSGVPAEKQPEFDINTMKAKLGLMGNTEFDQYQLRYAQSIGKTPANLNFADMQKVTQQYAKDKQTPELLAALIGLRGSQEKLASAQVAALPSDTELESLAKDYRNLDMPPGRIAAMREGRISYFPQILEKARAQAAAAGEPFSPATLEAKYDTWLHTEKSFADGEEAGMVRSFGNLMKHSAMGVKASEALSHHDLPSLQRIAGALHVATGGSAETVYDTIANFVADEASKAFLPGGGGQSERAEKAAHFERSLGDKQRTDNFKALMGLADSQAEELERQYAEGTFGKGPRIGRLFSTEVMNARDAVLGKKRAAGGGGEQQYVRTSTGRDGHQIGQTADGKWHDVKTGAVIQ